jgi:hypothetical protein
VAVLVLLMGIGLAVRLAQVTPQALVRMTGAAPVALVVVAVVRARLPRPGRWPASA